jgi:26S proteasome regulatory subunit T5
LHGPPGTGKTLLAQASAKQTDAVFLKNLPQLVQIFIGDGAKLLRDAFDLAKKSQGRGGAIILLKLPFPTRL